MARNTLRTGQTGTRDKVAALKAKDLSVRDIAALLGVSTQAVYKHLKALGLSPNGRKKKAGAA